MRGAADEADTEALIADLERMVRAPCAACAGTLCAHEVLISLVMGCKDAPRCLPCLANEVQQEPVVLRDRAFEHIRRKACQGAAWAWAGKREGFGEAGHPACLWPQGDGARTANASPGPSAAPVMQELPAADATWDAGDMGCGDLVLELRNRLRTLQPGQVLALETTDPGAREDIPAWCKLTGNTLLFADHPRYVIRRKSD